MSYKKRILWINNDRFDVKPDKSTWIEMSEILANEGYKIYILAGYKKSKPQPANGKTKIVYIKALNIPGVYRLHFLFKVAMWLLLKGRNRDIIIMNPETLWIVPILRAKGMKNFHLDIRTLPLGNPSIKKRLDQWLFWTFPISKFRVFVRGYSFITKRLKDAVENEFNSNFENYVIWQSGVNTKDFRPIIHTHNEKSGNFVLFYHGSIYRSRGIDKVIKALAEFKARNGRLIRFLIIGPGFKEAGLQNLVEKEGLEGDIEFKGLIPYEQIPSEIAKANCCICPLPDRIAWNVSSPLKVFEYMACEKPMILTPIPAHLDVVQGKKFIIWTKGHEIIDFRNAIEDAFLSREKLSEAAKKGSELAREQYDWSIQGHRLARYLREKFG